MKTITIISHHFLPEVNGTASRVCELSRLLSKIHKVVVLCPPPTFPFSSYKRVWPRCFQKEQYGSSLVFRLWTYPPRNSNPAYGERLLYYSLFPIFALPYLLWLLLLCNSVLVVSPPTSLLALTIFVRFFRRKLVLDITDLWHEEALGLGYIKENNVFLKFSRIAERISLAKCSRVFAATPTIKSFLMGEAPQGSEKNITVLYTPIDLNFFRPHDLTKKPQIVYTGNLGSPQPIYPAILALNEMMHSCNFHHLRLLLLGAGEKQQELKNIVVKGRHNNVVFGGCVPRSRIPTILSESIIGIVPLADDCSMKYAIPTKVYEYMACGLPFISYGASKEMERLVLESEAGINVKGNNPANVHDSLNRILGNSNDLHRMAFRGRKYVEHLLDPQTVATLLYEAF